MRLQWLDDKRTWVYWCGRRVFGNGDVYEGEFSYEKRSGRGVTSYANGDKYTGEVRLFVSFAIVSLAAPTHIFLCLVPSLALALCLSSPAVCLPVCLYCCSILSRAAERCLHLAYGLLNKLCQGSLHREARSYLGSHELRA